MGFYIISFFKFLTFETIRVFSTLFDLSSLDSTSNTGILFGFIVFCTSFITANWLMPQAIRFAHRFQLVDHPDFRKKHTNSTPILGGVSIFISVIFALILSSLYLYNYPNIELDFKIVFGLCSAVSLMVFFGLKDDILAVSPLEKIVFQVITALFVIVSCGVRIDNFAGLFNIYELPIFLSYVFSVFVFVIVVNAFNLIDGIDGLSASIGLLCTIFFGVFFYLNELVSQSIFMFCYAGALSAFLIYNFKKQLFLGDNGSMGLGVVIAFGVFSIISISNGANLVEGSGYFFNNISVIVLALISYPLLDMIRVFCVRLINGNNPFSPDRNHLHHHLINLKFNHFESTSIVVLYTISITVIAFALNSYNITSHFFIMLLLSSFIYIISWISNKKQNG